MTITVLWLFFTVPRVGLQCVFVVYSDHTHLLLKIFSSVLQSMVPLLNMLHFQLQLFLSLIRHLLIIKDLAPMLYNFFSCSTQ